MLADRLEAIAPGWPKRVGADGKLFLESAEHEPMFLGSSTRLFAWIDSRARVDRVKGAKFITQERFYEHLRMNAPHFDAIEPLPHYPAMPGAYYMHPPVPDGPTRRLEEFLDFFCPDTPVDRQLIKAFVLTTFWGGEPGRRPAFLITGPDQDPERGRGVGKSWLLKLVGEIVQHVLDVSPTDAIADIKTRLLSPDGRRKRFAMLDNVKTFKFSWADLENLITAPIISGREMYVGEGCRPNTITWGITLNGANLSTDLAQRCVPIKLRRPERYSQGWENAATAFVREHRGEIIADIRAILEGPRQPIDVHTRWASWEADVLARVEIASPCQGAIRERQGDVDDDSEERDIVAEFFADRLHARGHDPDGQIIAIPTAEAARWFNEATNQKLPTNRASAYLNGLGIPELRKSTNGRIRHYRWTGLRAVASSYAMRLFPDSGNFDHNHRI